MTIKPTIKSEAVSLLFIIFSFTAAVYFYFNFPAVVPTHWNWAGEADGFSSKGFAAFFFPVLISLIYVFFLIVPELDPMKKRYEEFLTVYHEFKTLMVGFLVLVFLYSGLAGLGYKIPFNIVIPALIGILFIIIGLMLNKIKPNWFFGIRTPWTISSEKVWKKTHALGAKIFVIMGILIILGTTLPVFIFWPLFIIVVLTGSLIPVIYSFLEFKKLPKRTKS
jgi:uncharacterized membrane protein